MTLKYSKVDVEVHPTIVPSLMGPSDVMRRKKVIVSGRPADEQTFCCLEISKDIIRL